jgi:hypothetical protein
MKFPTERFECPLTIQVGTDLRFRRMPLITVALDRQPSAINALDNNIDTVSKRLDLGPDNRRVVNCCQRCNNIPLELRITKFKLVFKQERVSLPALKKNRPRIGVLKITRIE